MLGLSPKGCHSVGKMSKEKGKAGEREVAAMLRERGFEARRGQQFAGGGDSPDVVHNIPGLHIEVKRTEKLDMYAALSQAEHDSKLLEYPVVFHRKNKRPWVIVMGAAEFLSLMKRIPQYDADN